MLVRAVLFRSSFFFYDVKTIYISYKDNVNINNCIRKYQSSELLRKTTTFTFNVGVNQASLQRMLFLFAQHIRDLCMYFYIS